MKQSLPSLVAATICGLAWALVSAAGDGNPPIGASESANRHEPGRYARTPASTALNASTASNNTTASPTFGVPSFELPAQRGPFLPPAREAPGLFGPHGIVPAAHAEDAVGPPEAPPPLPPAATLIADSIRTLSARRSITAKTRQGARLFGRELIGNGAFAQGPASSRLVRYDLQLLVKDRAVSRLQVSDGQYLWLVDDRDGEQEIERIEVDRLVTASPEGAADAAAPLRDPVIGGIGRLMTSLEKSFEFTGVVRSQLGNVAVYGVEGGWKPAILGRSMPDQFVKVSQGQGTYDTSALRGHIPNQVVVYLGVDDLFPYRIEYRRIAAGEPPSAAVTSSGTGVAPASTAGANPPKYEILTFIDFFEVRFDVLLDGSLFTFSPGTRPYIDITDSYLAKQKK